MNDIIKDFAFQSGFASAGFSNGKVLVQYELQLNKFARLIVDHCAGIAYMSDSTSGNDIAEEIHKYFNTEFKS